MKKALILTSILATATTTAYIFFKKKKQIQTLVSDMIFGYKTPCEIKDNIYEAGY